MNHDSDEYQAMQRDLAHAYGKYGQSKAGVEAWRSDPSSDSFRTTVPESERYPIGMRFRPRRGRLRALNGWLQIFIVAAVLALALCVGFVAGALWEMQHWVRK